MMLKAAALGIAVIQAEGASPETLACADVVSLTILDALDLLKIRNASSRRCGHDFRRMQQNDRIPSKAHMDFSCVMPAWIAGIQTRRMRPETSMSIWIPALHAGMMTQSRGLPAQTESFQHPFFQRSSDGGLQLIVRPLRKRVA
jgi:hypothetical protein